MKKFVQLILALAVAGATTHVGAAPRAAEDPTAVVISTTASAPKVKREAPQAKQTQSKSAKASSTKKGSKQGAAKGKQSKSKQGKKAG